MAYHKLCVLLYLVSLSISLFSQEKRTALVIGNDQYENATRLNNSVNDAIAIANRLKMLDFTVQMYTNLDQKTLKQAIDRFGENLKSSDVGLFYYSGHGIQLNGNNYLIPVDANLKTEQDAEYDCVDAGRILSKMESSGTHINIVILDACRNNPFEKSWNRDISNHGLAFMEAPTGSLIAYSTAPGTTASDGGGKNGLYTSYLLNVMLNPDLNVLQVFQEVRKKVRDSSNNTQVPWESTSLEEDFYFNQSKKIIAQITDSKKNETAPGGRDLGIQIEKLKSDTSFIWFEASSPELPDADTKAVAGFKNKIAEFLKSGGQVEINSNDIKNAGVQLMIKELNYATQRKVIQNKNNFNVIRYTSKHDLIQDLQLRKNRILTYLDDANQAEKSYRIADALKKYYWAYSLNEVYPGNILVSNANVSIPLKQSAEIKISSIIKGIRCLAVDSATDENAKSFSLRFFHGNNPVENINFRYWNGETWSDVVYSNNGRSIVEMHPGYSIKNVKIKLEYACIPESKFDPFLCSSIQLVFNDQFYNETNITFTKSQVDDVLSSAGHEIINKIIQKIKNKDQKFDPSLFTSQGYEIYKKLLLYGNVSLLNVEDTYSIYNQGGITYVRSVPCTFNFKDNKVKFSENLCFTLDSGNHIDNITFTLSDKAVKDIMSHDRWPQSSRFQIIDFLENYKTAYALERIDYIEKIFSNKALIIVGNRIQEKNNEDGTKYILTGENYEFTRLTKEQYLYRLKKVFNNNEYINVKFEDNVVKKRDNESEVYGINIKQNYFSANYADEGYLFLMIDMKDSTSPTIYVRSWQPSQSFSGHLINLSDFNY